MKSKHYLMLCVSFIVFGLAVKAMIADDSAIVDWPSWPATATSAAPAKGVTGLVLAVLLAIASWTDSRTLRIPNTVVYLALLSALAINALTLVTANEALLGWLGAIGFGQALLGAAALFLPFVWVYARGSCGAGDVKLATAIGALLGVELGVWSCLWCVVWCGGSIIARRFASQAVRWLFQPATTTGTLVGNLQNDPPLHEQKVPLSIFFTLGVVTALLQWSYEHVV